APPNRQYATAAATLRLPIATNTISATTASPTESFTCATPAAAPAARIRFFGFTAEHTIASTNAAPGFMASTPPIHFGIVGASPGFGRFANWRRAAPRRITPSPTLIHDTESDAVESVAALAACAT